MQLNALKPKTLLIKSKHSLLSELAGYFSDQGWQFDQTEITQKNDWINQAKSYDLLVADLELPSLETVKFLENLKIANPWQEILIVSNQDQHDIVVDLMRAGASDVIKPGSDFKELERVVDRILRKKALNQKYTDAFICFCKTSYEIRSADLIVADFNIQILDQLTKINRITDKIAAQVRLCFQEALINSLDHGNLELDSSWKEEIDSSGMERYELVKKQRLSDPYFADRLIFITVEYDGTSLNFRIKDQGKGFDIEEKLKENDDCIESHGRGLHLIYSIMDKVDYDKGGTEVLLSKKLVEI